MAQATGDLAGGIAQFIYDFLNMFSCFGGNVGAVVEDSRHGHGGNAGSLGYILDCDDLGHVPLPFRSHVTDTVNGTVIDNISLARSDCHVKMILFLGGDTRYLI